MLLRSAILSLSHNKAVEAFVRKSSLTRRVVRRFVAGENLEEAMGVANGLVQRGFKVSLDLLGEHVATEEEADAALHEYLRVLCAIRESPCYGGWMPEQINISVKLSQMGAHLGEAACASRLDRLLCAASDPPVFVRIDMEESALTDLTLRVFYSAFEKHRNVGIVLQSMLHRTIDDVEQAIRERARVRIVKGAYLEPPEIAHQKKRDVDEAYFQCATRLISDGVYPAIATHDHRMIARIESFAQSNGISSGRYEYQMLYGIRRRLQEQLKTAGKIVRVYVPYGNSWYPYFTRRLAERPANLLFFIRSLFAR